MPDDMNRRAYVMKYADVDSSLWYADRAYSLSKDYPDGRAEAMNHRAFVLYQKMRFSHAIEVLDSVEKMTHNQVELLCADVMRMKLSQRTGELRTLYRAWHSAERRLDRIDEELPELSPHHQERVLYARTEKHLVAATYYYYAHQDSLLREELNALETYMRLPLDTAQWCGYMYMLGTERTVAVDTITSTVNAFDNLVRVVSMASRSNLLYFQANSLQALAQLLDSPSRRQYIRERRGGGMNFIITRYIGTDNFALTDSLPLLLVEQSLRLFKECDDNFQTANVLRTKAELLFARGRYADALQPLADALKIVEAQHRIESKRLPYWEAGIYERLSLTYSALGRHDQAMTYRRRYLGMMEVMRQDLEENVRAEELRSYNNRLYINLSVILLLILSVGVFFWSLFRRVKRHGMRQEREAEESLQMLCDETRAREMQLTREKLANIERRAKVSLAESVLPYITRILNTTDMEYVAELADVIMRINDVLTDWIMVRQGKVAMNISTFPLQPLLDTIAKNRSTFQRKGVTLEVPSDVPYRIKADRALTLFMINTLCDNARKFTPSGGRVWIDLHATDTYVEVSVNDNGKGISPANVDKINNSKVFRLRAAVPDTSSGGTLASLSANDADEGSGFGFGLMNCKGIIAQMKKTSNRFGCCAFGVESTEGKGSRFWFRLPRILSLLLLVLMTTVAMGQGGGEGTVVNMNGTARLDDYEAASSAYHTLRSANQNGRYAEAMAAGTHALTLVPRDSIALRIRIENEMAVAAQSLGLWNEYRRHNRQCFLLYRTMTADPGLPIYARRLHLVKSELSWSQFFIIVLLLVSAAFIILVVRRSRRLRGARQNMTDALQLQTEQLNRVQYELDRLHIRNRILDNCLSTIKHETMYYPARLRQMARAEGTEPENLHQLASYYNEIYTILLEQAQRQTALRMALDETILEELRRRLMASVGKVPVRVATARRGGILEIRIKATEGEIPPDLFTPESGNPDAFVAREIVRMHDAACGYPGLRLYVENNEIIITLWKNSKLLSSKTFNWN